MVGTKRNEFKVPFLTFVSKDTNQLREQYSEVSDSMFDAAFLRCYSPVKRERIFEQFAGLLFRILDTKSRFEETESTLSKKKLRWALRSRETGKEVLSVLYFMDKDLFSIRWLTDQNADRAVMLFDQLLGLMLETSPGIPIGLIIRSQHDDGHIDQTIIEVTGSSVSALLDSKNWNAPSTLSLESLGIALHLPVLARTINSATMVLASDFSTRTGFRSGYQGILRLGLDVLQSIDDQGVQIEFQETLLEKLRTMQLRREPMQESVPDSEAMPSADDDSFELSAEPDLTGEGGTHAN